MKRAFTLLLFLALGVAARTALTTEPTSVADDRSSTFVAGTANPEEAFGPLEGPTLLGGASALIIAIFILLIWGAHAHRKSSDRLARLEAKLRVKGDPYA